jgi:hypothetical protein
VPQRAGAGQMARSGTLRRGTRTKRDRHVIRVEFCTIDYDRHAGAQGLAISFFLFFNRFFLQRFPEDDSIAVG